MAKQKILIQGGSGRMGRMLIAQILADDALELGAATELPDCPLLGQDAGLVACGKVCGVQLSADEDAAVAASDAAILFSAPAPTMQLARKMAAAGKAVVIGTTGLTAEQKAELRQLAEQGARIVCAPNMSVGVNLLFALCAKVGKILGEEYDVEVVEMHHNQKKDAPSGTAVRLGEILCEARGLSYEQDVRHGRVGMPGARTRHEIGMHSLRGGDVVGDHTVIFATGGERVELTHKASSRETFVKGAVRAVKFLAAAPAGLYDMQDVLGL